MKKILIPKDFSIQSENASKYAVALCSTFRAELVIANAFLVPEEAETASRVAWPLVGYETLKQQSTTDLELFVQKLGNFVKRKNLNLVSNIDFESRSGSVLDVTYELVQEKMIDLVVMGMVGAGFLPQIVFGSNCRTMIERATFPVLYIPGNTKFKVIEQIAFATDLDLSDIKNIKNMLDLLGCPHVQIRLIHISKKEYRPGSKEDISVEEFLKEFKLNIENVDVVYDAVSYIDIEDGLQSLISDLEIDVLAMVHRHHSFINRLFHGSHTQKISRLAQVPLLVLPPLGVK